VSYVVTFRGLPACPCLAEWLPVYERMLQHRGTLTGDLRLYQLIGGAAASAGTHSQGGAFDVTDLVGDDDVWVARQMGADATWARTAAQGFTTKHLHGVLRGCPHNGPAAYQIAAVDAGYNGLGSGGRGGRDDGPRPLSGRTWREGIAWAEKEMDMPYTDWPQKDREALVRDVVNGLQRRDLYAGERDDTPADAMRAVFRLEKKLDKLIAGLGSVDTPKSP